MTSPRDWIVRWCHSRSLYPGRPFVPMPLWVNEIRDRCKRLQDPTEGELEACRAFVLAALAGTMATFCCGMISQ